MSIPELPWQTSATQPLRGIDLSAHQTPGRITLSGLDFVIARATYGDRVDQTARAWAASAVDAGVNRFSVYAFVRHSSRPEHAPARQLAAIREALDGVRSKWRGPLCVYIDAEDNTTFDGAFNRERALDHYRAIAEELRGAPLKLPPADHAVPVGLYTAPGWWQSLNAAPEWEQLPAWLAHYGARTTARPAAGRFPKSGIWQFGLVRHGGFALDGNVASYWRPELPWPNICEPAPHEVLLPPHPADDPAKVLALLAKAETLIASGQACLKEALKKVSEMRAALR